MNLFIAFPPTYFALLVFTNFSPEAGSISLNLLNGQVFLLRAPTFAYCAAQRNSVEEDHV